MQRLSKSLFLILVLLLVLAACYQPGTVQIVGETVVPEFVLQLFLVSFLRGGLGSLLLGTAVGVIGGLLLGWGAAITFRSHPTLHKASSHEVLAPKAETKKNHLSH